jgi:hypothetical protein
VVVVVVVVVVFRDLGGRRGCFENWWEVEKEKGKCLMMEMIC